MSNSKLNLAWPIILTFLIIMGWMPFEGLFERVLSVGIVLTAIWGWVVYRQINLLDPLNLSIRHVVFGAGLGLVAPAVILGLMVLKTGVHAHGPEFSPAEISWVTQQFFIWPIVGGVAGLGFRMLLAGKATN